MKPAILVNQCDCMITEDRICFTCRYARQLLYMDGTIKYYCILFVKLNDSIWITTLNERGCKNIEEKSRGSA